MRIVLVALLAIGCSNDGPNSPALDASSTFHQLVCESGGGGFPPLDKACTAASDCFVALHQINCCGTQVAVGLNQTAYGAFATGEGSCAAAFAECDCALVPTEAEDGRTEAVGAIQVRCETGLCRTYVP